MKDTANITLKPLSPEQLVIVQTIAQLEETVHMLRLQIAALSAQLPQRKRQMPTYFRGHDGRKIKIKNKKGVK